MNEKYRNIEDIYDNYNDVTPQYDEKESFKEDTDLDETLPKTFEGKIDFLAADEEEAIEGYDKVLLALTDKKYEHIRKQLEIIRDEEVAHKEFLEKAINDLKAIYVDPSENRDDVVDLEEENTNLEEKKISKSPIHSYIYKGPIYKNGFLCSEYWEGETQAVSEAQALNNLRFQAGKYLGYNVGSHKVNMYLKPENLYKLENIDDYYDSYEDIEPIKQCDKCGALLSDNGNCPVCDDGEEDYK